MKRYAWVCCSGCTTEICAIRRRFVEDCFSPVKREGIVGHYEEGKTEYIKLIYMSKEMWESRL